MVDKIWYDWQHAHPENFWSFFGGSVGAHSEQGLYAKFPTGGPPFLNVSNGFGPVLALWLTGARSIVRFAVTDGWNPPKRHDLPSYGYEEREVMLRL